MNKKLQLKRKTTKFTFFIVIFAFTCFFSSTVKANGTKVEQSTIAQPLQQQKEHIVTLKYENATIKTILLEIQKQTRINFVYKDADLASFPKKSIDVKKVTLRSALDQLLLSSDLSYSFGETYIMIFKKKQEKNEDSPKIAINGKVVDENKEPILGATLLLAGTTTGAITDSEGNFTITAKEDDMIDVSYLGYKAVQILASKIKKNSVIELKVDVLNVDDVVVTGYQTISRERATGSYNIIKNDQVDKPSAKISERLIGTTAGVVSSVNTDGELKFQVRGQTSLNVKNVSKTDPDYDLYKNVGSPLIVVDGFAVEDGFNSINPNDVESMTVLKDASAASIWGARSANGVIVITTKKVATGKVNVNVSSFYKFSRKLDLDYLRNNAPISDYIDFEIDAFKKNFYGGPWTPANDAVISIQNRYSEVVVLANELRLGHISTDEYNQGIGKLRGQDNSQQIKDHMLNNPASQQYNINISGGTEKMSNSLSLLYGNSNSNFKHDNKQEYLVNYKTQIKTTKWLEFSFSGMFQYNNEVKGGLDASSVGIDPYELLIEQDGSYSDVTSDYYMPMVKRYIPIDKFPYSDWAYNPLIDAKNTKKRTTDINTRLQAALTLNLMKGLNFTSSMQYELFNTSYNDIYNDKTFLVRDEVNTKSSWDRKYDSPVKANLPKGGFRDRRTVSINSYNFRNQFNFNRTFAEKHSINMIAGMEVSDRVRQTANSPRTYGYDDDKLTVGTFPSGISGFDNMWGSSENLSYTNSYTYYTDRYFSAYGNLAYTFDNKYTISGSIRTDASNMISDDPKYRYSPFWSIGASWNIHREKFMQSVNWINRLAVRATYGYNGNVDKTTAFMPLIRISGAQNKYTNETTGSISSYGNPSLRWEKTGTFNVGVDFDILGGKLNGSLDVYNKKGKNLIVAMTIPSIHGTTSQKLNSGEMVNNGFELRLGSSLPIANRIRWTGDVTLAYNQNEITKLYKAYYTASNLYGGGTASYVEGYNAQTIWSYNYKGTINKGTAESPDWQPVVQGLGEDLYDFSGWPPGEGRPYLFDQGTSVAPYTASISSSFRIYDFDFSFIITGKFGHVFKRTGFNYHHMGSTPNKYLSEGLEGGSKFVPVPSENQPQYHYWDLFYPYLSYLTENASHIRIQEISFGYSLPSQHLKKLGINSLKLYCQVNNVGTILFNKYGEDPENKYGTIRPLTSFTFGLKLNF